MPKKKKESKNIVNKLRDRELGIKKKRKKFPKGYVGTSQAPMRPGVALVPTNVHLHRRRRRLEHRKDCAVAVANCTNKVG
eukprot:SAG31_NODE_773_length_12173_cov_15.778173_16_plen_79_part_01